MYRLIATDCDGTILDSEGFLPGEIIRVFRELDKRGVRILIATGRNDIIAKDYLDELGIGCPIMGCNGATLVNFYTGENFFIHSLDKESLDAIFDICEGEGIGVKAFTADTCYTNDRKLYEGGISLIVTKYKKKLSYALKYELVEDMRSISDKGGFIKAVVVENDVERLTYIKEKINSLLPEVKAVQSNWNCIDINPAEVSKGNALMEYANMLGIKKEEIIAFGDSENDISMLEKAGLGIAVGNADEKVKKSADRVISTNDECGVAVFLKEIFGI